MQDIVQEKRDSWKRSKLRRREAQQRLAAARQEMEQATAELFRDLVTAMAVFLRQSSEMTTRARALTLDASGLTVTQSGRLVASLYREGAAVILSVVTNGEASQLGRPLETAEPILLAARVLEALKTNPFTAGDAFAALH